MGKRERDIVRMGQGTGSEPRGSKHPGQCLQSSKEVRTKGARKEGGSQAGKVKAVCHRTVAQGHLGGLSE